MAASTIEHPTSPVSKKRKTLDSPEKRSTSIQSWIRCRRCRFSCTDVNELLTHTWKTHEETNDARGIDRVHLSLDVNDALLDMFMNSLDITDSNREYMGTLRRYSQNFATDLLAGLRQCKGGSEHMTAQNLAKQLQSLFGNDQDALLRLSKATQSALLFTADQISGESLGKSPITKSASNETLASMDEQDQRTSLHEEAAAEALTGLRQMTSPTSKDNSENGSSKANSPMQIRSPVTMKLAGSRPTVAVPSLNNEMKSQPPAFSSRSGTPVSSNIKSPTQTLPSIFSRRLLAPISSPYDYERQQTLNNPNMDYAYMNQSPSLVQPTTSKPTHLPTPPALMSVSSNPPHVLDWKMLQSQNHMSEMQQLPLQLQVPPQSATITPVTSYYAQQRVEEHASPVKRKALSSSKKHITGQELLPRETNVATPTASNSTPTHLTVLRKNTKLRTDRQQPIRKANPRRWTKEEDDALRKAVENHREKNWKAIASQVPGRNHTQCLQRWTKVLAPGLVKGHWSLQEDELLRSLVASEQKNWGDVAAKIPGRTSKQCRERWHNHLDPNIVRGAYTPEEDRIILEAQARLGNRWSVIAAMLPGRTEDAVKIRWKSHCRVWKARKYLRKSSPEHNQSKLTNDSQSQSIKQDV